MKLKYLLFLTLASFTFACGDDEKDNNPQPESNDNSKIEGDWIEKEITFTEYDSLDQYLGESGSVSRQSHYYRFKSQGNFEESNLFNGTFHLIEQGTYNLNGKVLTITLPDGPPQGYLNAQTGVFSVDTLTATKLTFIDTLGNINNNPDTKYGILKYSLYR